jgi:hypothetical protein
MSPSAIPSKRTPSASTSRSSSPGPEVQQQDGPPGTRLVAVPNSTGFGFDVVFAKRDTFVPTFPKQEPTTVAPWQLSKTPVAPPEVAPFEPDRASHLSPLTVGGFDFHGAVSAPPALVRSGNEVHTTQEFFSAHAEGHRTAAANDRDLAAQATSGDPEKKARKKNADYQFLAGYEAELTRVDDRLTRLEQRFSSAMENRAQQSERKARKLEYWVD